MAHSYFASKINWRLILMHLIACIFFIYSASDFSMLIDFKVRMDLSRIGANSHYKDIAEILNKDLGPNAASKISDILVWIFLIKCIGLLIFIFTALPISIKRRWHWLNLLIVFIVMFFLQRLIPLNVPYLKYLFNFPGVVFRYDNPWRYIVNGLAMLSISLFLLFSKKVIQIISPATYQME